MKSERKIIRLFSRLNIGGPAIHVVNLSAGLARYGYDTRLVVGSCDSSEGSMEDVAVARGVKLIRLNSFQAAISPLKDLIAFFAIIGILWRERPSIVHTHTFKAGLLGRVAAAITGVPIVVHTYHGHLLSGYWGKWGTAVIRVIESILARLSTRILAVSRQVAEDLIAAKVVPRGKVQVMELGFDMDEIHRQLNSPPTLRRDLGIPANARVVGIVGRLVPVKSVDLLFACSCAPARDLSRSTFSCRR